MDTSFGSSGGAVSGPARGVRETVAHGGLGLGVGGALTFFGALVASSQLIAGLLLAGSVLAIGYALRVASSVGPNRHAAKRYVGTAAGLAIAAALVGGIGPSPSLDLGLRTLGPALFAVGFVTHAVLAEYDRRRLAAWASAPR